MLKPGGHNTFKSISNADVVATRITRSADTVSSRIKLKISGNKQSFSASFSAFSLILFFDDLHSAFTHSHHKLV